MGTALAGVHLAAASIPWVIGMGPVAGAAVSALVLAAGFLQNRRHASRNTPEAERALSLSADGRAMVVTRTGDEVECRLEAIPVNHPSWVMLQLRQADGSRRVVHVAADACGPDAHRRLRVFLRWAVQVGPHAPIPG